MIYWALVEEGNFASACKIITYLTFAEYDFLLRKPIQEVINRGKRKGIKEWKVRLVRDACLHYCYLKKMDLSMKGKYGKYPKIERVYISKELSEYWYYPTDGRKPYKVCGCPRKGYAYGWVCCNGAGLSTLHPGYGYCKDHEDVEMNPHDKEKFWNKLRSMYKAPSFAELMDRAKEIDELSNHDMVADIAYLELARQAILSKMNNYTTSRDGAPMAFIQQLTVISAEVGKLKVAKTRLEQTNWIPPQAMLAELKRMFEFIVQGENNELRDRLLRRIQEYKSDQVLPMLTPGAVPRYHRTSQTDNLMKSADPILRKKNASWAESIERRIPAYKRGVGKKWVSKKQVVETVEAEEL